MVEAAAQRLVLCKIDNTFRIRFNHQNVFSAIISLIDDITTAETMII